MADNKGDKPKRLVCKAKFPITLEYNGKQFQLAPNERTEDKFSPKKVYMIIKGRRQPVDTTKIAFVR